MKQDHLNKLRLAAGLAPKYDRAEREHLEEKEAKQRAISEAANNRAPANVLSDIARRHLNIRTLKAQNSDSLDFHEVSVWGIEKALKAAFKAGQEAAKKVVKEGDESKEEAKQGGTDFDPKGGERYPEEDKVDPDVKEKGKPAKKGKSSENYKTPKNKSAKQVSEDEQVDEIWDLEKAEKGGEKYKKKFRKGHNATADDASDSKIKMKKLKKKPVSEDEQVDEIWDLEKAEKSGEKYKKKFRKTADNAAEDKIKMKKLKKKPVNEMDIELEMGDDTDGAGDMKARRMALIRGAVDKVQGAPVDVGDEEDFDSRADADDFAMDDIGDEEEPMNDFDDFERNQERGEEVDDFMSAADEMDWSEEDCEMAVAAFQPENEEEYVSGFDAFRRGEGEPEGCGDDFHNGYETARMTRMSSVAEGKKSKIKEGAEDATVFDKDYHHPAGANGHWDMAQHKGEPHVQGRGQEVQVKVPADIKSSLKEEIAKLQEDSNKIRYRDEYRADFYENTAKAFELLLTHLEEGTKHSLLLAQIDLNRVMSPMTERLPRDVYMYIVRGGKPASLTELFREVKVKSDKGVDPSKEDYTK